MCDLQNWAGTYVTLTLFISVIVYSLYLVTFLLSVLECERVPKGKDGMVQVPMYALLVMFTSLSAFHVILHIAFQHNATLLNYILHFMLVLCIFLYHPAFFLLCS